jgi:hypothetical protein
MYLGECRVYPEPVIEPPLMTPNLINEVGKYLKVPPVTDTQLVNELPAVFVCPWRRDLVFFQEAMGPPDALFWVTGYDYCGRVDESPPPWQILKPNRIARAKGSRRGVLWTDGLNAARVGEQMTCVYFHCHGGTEYDPQSQRLLTFSPMLGRHVAWSDGSVEWIPRADIPLEPDQFDSAATYKATWPDSSVIWYYF